MVPELVESVGLVTGQKRGTDEVKDIGSVFDQCVGSVEVGAVSEVDICSVEESAKELAGRSVEIGSLDRDEVVSEVENANVGESAKAIVRELEEKTGEEVKSVDTLESIEKEESVDISVQDPSLPKDVAVEGNHSQQDTKVEIETNIQAAEVVLKEKDQPSIDTFEADINKQTLPVFRKPEELALVVEIHQEASLGSSKLDQEIPADFQDSWAKQPENTPDVGSIIQPVEEKPEIQVIEVSKKEEEILEKVEETVTDSDKLISNPEVPSVIEELGNEAKEESEIKQVLSLASSNEVVLKATTEFQGTQVTEISTSALPIPEKFLPEVENTKALQESEFQTLQISHSSVEESQEKVLAESEPILEIETKNSLSIKNDSEPNIKPTEVQEGKTPISEVAIDTTQSIPQDIKTAEIEQTISPEIATLDSSIPVQQLSKSIPPEDPIKSTDPSKDQNQNITESVKSSPIELQQTTAMDKKREKTPNQKHPSPTKSASDLQEETDVLKPLERRDTLKHIKRPSLPLTKPSHDDKTPTETHPEGVPFAELLLESHLESDVDKISFSPQLVSKIISDKNLPKEERGLALKSWNYKPTELDFVKQVRNLLDERDNEIICYRARLRAGYCRMRDPHDHFLSEMNKLVKEYESDEDEIYEVVKPPPPPKEPTPPPPQPPVNEFLQEVLRALNAPWHPKPAPEEPKTFVKQVKDLLNTEELSGDGQALYFTKERGPLEDSDMVHKVRIILDEKESSMGIKKHETQTVDHVPFLSDVLVLLNDEAIPNEEPVEEVKKSPAPKVVVKPEEKKEAVKEPEKKWKEIKVAEIFVRDNVYPVLACVTSDKFKIFVSALESQRVELASDDLEAATITVVEDNGYKSDVAKIVVSPVKF